MIMKLPVVAQIAIQLDYLWAAVCIMGAVYFIFRT